MDSFNAEIWLQVADYFAERQAAAATCAVPEQTEKLFTIDRATGTALGAHNHKEMTKITKGVL